MRRLLKPHLCLLVLVQATACAQVMLNVSIDTTPLVGHPAGPFYFVLAFTDGSGVGDGNNTVSVHNVSFGSGGPFSAPTLVGGAAGSLETGVTIVDNPFASWFFEQFVPGDQLSFSLALTSNDEGGFSPDRLTFYIFDNSGVPLPTLAPAGDVFFAIDLGSAHPILSAFGSDPSRAPTVGTPVSVAAPSIPFQAITIDIKPGDDPPGINPLSEGTTPVAILSSKTFDAPHTIDQTSLTFGRTGNEQSLAFCDPNGEDVNGDGLPDLICHFVTRLAGFENGDTVGILTGKTVRDVVFKGTDPINVVGK